MEICTAAMLQSYVLMSGTLSILHFECSPSQIQWRATSSHLFNDLTLCTVSASFVASMENSHLLQQDRGA